MIGPSASLAWNRSISGVDGQAHGWARRGEGSGCSCDAGTALPSGDEDHRTETFAPFFVPNEQPKTSEKMQCSTWNHKSA